MKSKKEPVRCTGGPLHCTCCLVADEPNDDCYIHGLPDPRICPCCGQFRSAFRACKRCGCAHGLLKEDRLERCPMLLEGATGRLQCERTYLHDGPCEAHETVTLVTEKPRKHAIIIPPQEDQ